MTGKVGAPGTSPVDTSNVTSAQDPQPSATQQSHQAQEPQPQPAPQLNEQNKSQRKTEKQMSGVMKQALFQGALNKQQGSSTEHREKTIPAPPDMRPQIVRTAEGKFNLIRPAPLLENLILRGGGAKGIGNPPALIEMEKQGKLDGLKHVVGTSAGALTALCLASGHSSLEFQNISDSTKMTSLLKTPDGFEKRYPTLKFGTIGANGGAAVEIADRNSAKKVSDYLQEQWTKNEPAFKEKLERLVAAENQRSPGAGDQARERLRKLQNQNLDSNRTDQMITFNDLRLLHQLEPSKFRELTLTGWDEKNKSSTYFNAADYPDMPIAVAGRISMAIPPAFASVKYDPKDGKGVRDFADGGIGTNMPSEVVTRTKAGDPKSELTGRQRENVLVKTGIMTFDEEGAKNSEKISVWERAKATLMGREARPELQGAYRAMHGSDKQNDHTTGLGNRVRNTLIGGLAGNSDIGVVNQKDQQKIAESAANCFVIAHGDLGTFSLTASPERIEAAKKQATELIREQLKQRENQAYAQEFDSVDEILRELSPQEKAAVSKGPIPNPAQYPKGAGDPNFQADLDLYNKTLHENQKSQS